MSPLAPLTAGFSEVSFPWKKKGTGAESVFMCFSMRIHLQLQLQTHRWQQVQLHEVVLMTLPVPT